MRSAINLHTADSRNCLVGGAGRSLKLGAPRISCEKERSARSNKNARLRPSIIEIPDSSTISTLLSTWLMIPLDKKGFQLHSISSYSHMRIDVKKKEIQLLSRL